MYDGCKIIPGLIIFVLFITIPIWYNGGVKGEPPKPVLPKDAKTCVLPAAEIRAEHMKLLNDWRDDVLRDGKRAPVMVDGKPYPKSLMLNCIKCHTSTKQFCDPCHTYASVRPYCWDCHLAPVE